MINAQKTELLCKTALYERAEGSEPLRIKRKYEDSFAGGALRSILPAVAAYSLIVFLIAAGATKGEFGLPKGTASLIILAAGFIIIGVAFTAVYYSLSSYMLSRRYENIRCSIRKYELYKERIEKMNSAADGGTDRGEA